MKKIVFLLALANVFGFSYSQDFKGKITYRATLDNKGFYKRLMKDSTVSEVSRKAQLNDISTSSPINFILTINGKEASYRPEFGIETTIGTYKTNRTDLVAETFNTYYTNRDTGERFYQSYFTREVLVDLDKIDWKLTQETKKIGKYTCYKATATIDTEQLYKMNFMDPVIAWYTPEIPVPFGIKEFSGLPGLTMELITDYEKGKVSYKAIRIEFDPKEKITINKPTGKKHLSQQEYIELIKKLNADRSF